MHPRRNRRPRTTRSVILDQLKQAVRDSLVVVQDAPPPCNCHDCRITRAVDVSPNPRVLLITPQQLNRIFELAAQFPDLDISGFCYHLFKKRPPLLREIEADAVIAHLERRDFLASGI